MFSHCNPSEQDQDSVSRICVKVSVDLTHLIDNEFDGMNNEIGNSTQIPEP